MAQPDLNDEYEIESKVPDMAAVMARYAEWSETAARRSGAMLDISYGPDARHRLDVLRAEGTRCPAILFFHGGYWRAGCKEDRRFPATIWNGRGVAWVPVEYRLAPAVILDEAVNDARRAVAWFFENAADHGCDPAAIHVAGNSAGGHLVGMLAATGWQASLSLPDDVVKSATAISGLFDLQPLRATFVNDWLALDAAAARRNSPITIPPRAGLPMVVSWGGRESASFREQSERYGEACAAAGAAVELFERVAADHFSIIGELAQPESPLFAAIDRAVRAPR